MEIELIISGCQTYEYYGFHNISISQYVNDVNFFICEFKQRMKDNFISEMNTFFNKSPKCH